MPLHLHILNLGKQSDNNNVLVKILWYLLDNKGFNFIGKFDFFSSTFTKSVLLDDDLIF